MKKNKIDLSAVAVSLLQEKIDLTKQMKLKDELIDKLYYLIRVYERRILELCQRTK